MKYNPALDGTRALAVLLVLIFHAVNQLPVPQGGGDWAFYRIAGMGWVGVDLFFVLSGYLITSILVNSRKGPLKRYCKAFYARRALRILPLYFVFVPSVLILLQLFGTPRPAWSDWLTQLTYTQNSIGLFFHSQVGAFLGHTWSLAVEEWFYLIWPFFVFFCAPPTLRRIALFGIVAIPALRLALLSTGFDAPVYTSSLTRFDTLLVGALLALSPPSAANRRVWVAAGAVAISLFLATRLMTSDLRVIIQFNSGVGYTLVAFGAAALIAACAGPANRLAGVLAFGPLRHIGKISYGIYLFHLPVLAMLAAYIIPHTVNVPYFARWLLLIIPAALITIGLASLSFAGFEKKMLSLKDRFAYGEVTVAPTSANPAQASA